MVGVDRESHGAVLMGQLKLVEKSLVDRDGQTDVVSMLKPAWDIVNDATFWRSNAAEGRDAGWSTDCRHLSMVIFISQRVASDQVAAY